MNQFESWTTCSSVNQPPPTVDEIILAYEKCVDEMKRFRVENPLFGMDVLQLPDEWMPKTVKDKDGNDCELLGVMVNSKMLGNLFSGNITDPAFDGPIIAMLVGEPKENKDE